MSDTADIIEGLGVSHNAVTEREPVSLTEKTISGATWATVSIAGQRILSLTSTIILARKLHPSAYGLLGMATVLIGFVNIFKDLGTSSALIQRKEVTDELTSSIFWLNLLFGLVAVAVIIGLAPLAALFYHEPQVRRIMSVLSASFFISSLSIVPQTLLTREMAFKKLACIELIAAGAAVTVAITMALSGAGVWSLVSATITNAIILTLSVWSVSSWRPSLHLSWSQVRSIGAYSLHLSGFNIFNYFIRNADNLIIGRYLGSTALGYYSLAYSLMLYPLQNITWGLGRVLFPALAQIQNNDARLRQAYTRSCAIIATITFPLMMGMIVTSQPLIATLLSSKWMPVVPLVMILAPVGLIQSIGTTVGHIYAVKGRTDWLFWWGLAAGIVIVLSFFIGLPWGIAGVASSYAIVSFVLQYPSFAFAFRLINLSFIDFVRTLWPPIKHAALMSIVVILLRIGMARVGLALPWAELSAAVLVGGMVYCGFILWEKPPVLQDIIKLLHLRRIPWLNSFIDRLAYVER